MSNSNSCKLCGLLPNAELSTALMTKSSRWIANNYAIGKTTVNTHRKACMGIGMPQATEARMEDNELKEVVWNGDKGELRTGTYTGNSLSDVSPESILEMFGYNSDDIEIVGVLREKHAQYWSRDLGEMLWKHSYAFGVKRKQASQNEDSVDPVQLLKELGIKSKPKTTNIKNGEDSTWVLDWADWQVCKAEGGGSAGFVQRFDQVMESAQIRLDELRSTGRKLNELLIIGGGDIVEGCVIYPQQSFHIDGHRRDQIRLAVATILQGLYTLAPQFDKVRLLVVPGNHGEHRINGNRTAIGDNDDLLVFEMAQVAIANDPNMQHVSFEIAEDEVSMVTEVQGWKYGATHGDVYGRGGGSGIRNKVFNWVRTMAANRHPVGLVDVLVTHHYHHDALEDWGSMLWVQNPTMDGGSHYYKEATGHYARHGMNSWVVTKTERFQDKQILR